MIVVCRRIEDTIRDDLKGVESVCSKCNAPVYVENTLENEPDPKECLHCCDPNTALFVELPPDEFGHSSMTVSAGQILAKGDWHKEGFWHSHQWIFNHVE